MSNELPQKDEVHLHPKLVIRAQTLEEELDRIQSTMNRMELYKQKNYLSFVKLPDTPEPIYVPEIYEVGIKFLEANRGRIEATFPTFAELSKAWGFKMFPEYQVLITRYGMGGNFNSNTGKITMRINDDGTFAREKPHHTVIHEIVHIGVDHGIVRKFSLSEAEKELMIDLMVSTLFEQPLHDYRIQPDGDLRIAPFVTAETMKNLPEAIGRYVAKYPR